MRRLMLCVLLLAAAVVAGARGARVWVVGGSGGTDAGLEVSFAMAEQAAAPFSTWVASSMDLVFRDTPAPKRPVRQVDLLAAGGEYEAAQVVVKAPRDLAALRAGATALAGPEGAVIPANRVQCRFVGYQFVEKNSKAAAPEELVRKAPAWFPDPLLEEKSVAVKAGENQPVLVTVGVPRGTVPGIYRGAITLAVGRERVEVPLAVEVLPFELPERPTLFVTNWFNVGAIADKHGVKLYQEPFWRLLEVYAHDMAAHRQNVAMVPPDLVDVWIEPDGSLTFGFDRFDRWVDIFTRAGAADRLEIMHMGGRTTNDWECPTFTIGKRPALVRATGQRQDIEIEQFLPGLVAHLKEKGWLERSMLHIADEPIPVNVESWLAASRRVHAAAPELRRIDAIHVPGLPGDLEVWVPQLNFFDESYEKLHAAQEQGVAELWFYTAWVPQGHYPNRLMDLGLIKTRLLHWVNFLYGATGYLHWGLNWWNLDFGHFSPGDEWIIYPGTKGPRSSLRWEAMRDGLEDYEYLKLVAATCGQARAEELGRQMMRTITDYDRDPAKLLEVRRQMAKEIVAGGG